MQCMCEPDGGTHATQKSVMSVETDRERGGKRLRDRKKRIKGEHVPSTTGIIWIIREQEVTWKGKQETRQIWHNTVLHTAKGCSHCWRFPFKRGGREIHSKLRRRDQLSLDSEFRSAPPNTARAVSEPRTEDPEERTCFSVVSGNLGFNDLKQSLHSGITLWDFFNLYPHADDSWAAIQKAGLATGGIWESCSGTLRS